MADADIRSTALAEASNEMFARKNKLAASEVSELVPRSENTVRGLSEDSRVIACNGYLIDPLLDPETSSSLS